MNKHTVKQVVKEVGESKLFRTTVYTFGVSVVVILIFQAGVIVGFHRATFSHDWDDNYSKNFGLMHSFRPLSGMPENFPNTHGAIGKIITSTPPLLSIEDKDGTEKAILIKTDTVIRKMREDATAADLTPNTEIIVIGNPNTQGQIEAKLIRIIPSDLPLGTPLVPAPLH